MKRKNIQQQTRRGAITVLAAIMAVVLVGMVAFSVDVGYVLSAKEELQRSADSSALAEDEELAGCRRVEVDREHDIAVDYRAGRDIERWHNDRVQAPVVRRELE